ncbi:MAG: hotdog fold thioesterase [Rubricoccaceae bacterium]|nr:hotdog fold thioesterase [Rubricoccaceae bacterium]
MPDLPADLFDRPSLDKTLGIEYEELTADRVVATMPVEPRVHQPLGYLHGGASVVLAESVASMGANATAFAHGKAAFGLEINANHLRPKQEGTLRAIAEPLHKGRTTHVWQVRIVDEAEALICAARCTLALVDMPAS